MSPFLTGSPICFSIRQMAPMVRPDSWARRVGSYSTSALAGTDATMGRSSTAASWMPAFLIAAGDANCTRRWCVWQSAGSGADLGSWDLEITGSSGDFGRVPLTAISGWQSVQDSSGTPCSLHQSAALPLVRISGWHVVHFDSGTPCSLHQSLGSAPPSAGLHA